MVVTLDPSNDVNFYIDGDSMRQHNTKFREAAERLTAAGQSLKEDTRACLLLRTLPESWQSLVSTLSANAATANASDGKLMFDAVGDSLNY
jgi:gag-polypeptide of LTR copia-type